MCGLRRLPGRLLRWQLVRQLRLQVLNQLAHRIGDSLPTNQRLAQPTPVASLRMPPSWLYARGARLPVAGLARCLRERGTTNARIDLLRYRQLEASYDFFLPYGIC